MKEQLDKRLKPVWQGEGMDGRFLATGPKGKLQIISAVGEGWEHVSVTAHGKKRIPTWEEMCFVKNLFWNDDECVVQFHPPTSNYVNTHRYVLHLWRSLDAEFPMPPRVLV